MGQEATVEQVRCPPPPAQQLVRPYPRAGVLPAKQRRRQIYLCHTCVRSWNNACTLIPNSTLINSTNIGAPPARPGAPDCARSNGAHKNNGAARVIPGRRRQGARYLRFRRAAGTDRRVMASMAIPRLALAGTIGSETGPREGSG